MSLKSISNMLVSSVIQSLDKRLVVGKTSTKAISLLNVLKKSFEYAIAKYNSGEEDYFKDITQLNLKIQKLKYECPDICSFRDKFIFEEIDIDPDPIDPDPEEPDDPIEPEEPPHIEDSTIPLTFTNVSDPQSIFIEDFVKGITLGEVGSIQISEISSDIDLFVDGLPVEENHTYPADVSFSVMLKEDFRYENYIEEGSCNVIKINRENLEQELEAGYRIVGVDSSGKVVLQTLTPSLDFKTLVSTLSDNITESFKIRVTSTENDNLWSNVAMIDLVFSPVCGQEICIDEDVDIAHEHSESISISLEGLIDEVVDRIKVKNITFTDGTVLYNNQEYFSNSELELIVTREDLINNLLVWQPSTVQESTLFIKFTTPSINDFNYCSIINTFKLTKLQADG